MEPSVVGDDAYIVPFRAGLPAMRADEGISPYMGLRILPICRLLSDGLGLAWKPAPTMRGVKMPRHTIRYFMEQGRLALSA